MSGCMQPDIQTYPVRMLRIATRLAAEVTGAVSGGWQDQGRNAKHQDLPAPSEAHKDAASDRQTEM